MVSDSSASLDKSAVTSSHLTLNSPVSFWISDWDFSALPGTDDQWEIGFPFSFLNASL